MDTKDFINVAGGKYHGQIHTKEKVPHGDGLLMYDNDREYKGSFKYGKPNGTGSMKNKDGSVYIGNFRNGMYNGFGKLTYIDGSNYKGNFKDGKRFGEGVLTDSMKRETSGHWENDKFVA